MSEPRIDGIGRELRATAPPAPEALRERVRALPEPAPRRTFRLRLRPALAVAGATAVALGIGAAVIHGLSGGSGTPADRTASRAPSGARASEPQKSLQRDSKATEAVPGTAIPPSSRLQSYGAQLRLRVGDGEGLSDAMKEAIRDTRRLGGYVVSARYSQAAQGDASLVVRVPIAHVQDAIARFSSLGTIVSQRISLQDLQPQADRLAKSIAVRRRRVAELEAKGDLTAAERAELAAARAELARLTRRRATIVRQGAYAKVSLALTTRKAAAAKEQPGAFDSFLDDAGNILGKEAIAVLYVLVVAGPFALLAALALVGERARRRRANHILLERAGASR